MKHGDYVFVEDDNGRCLGAGKVEEIDGIRVKVSGLAMKSTMLGKMPDFEGQWFDRSRVELHPQSFGWTA